MQEFNNTSLAAAELEEGEFLCQQEESMFKFAKMAHCHPLFTPKAVTNPYPENSRKVHNSSLCYEIKQLASR